MRISTISRQNFKGYDAVPIKNIYMQGICDKEQKSIFEELKKVGENEGFNTYALCGTEIVSEYNKGYSGLSRWAQDDKIFVEKNGKVNLVANYWSHAAKNFTEASNIKTETTLNYVEGGNIFIGKKTNGEKYALLGADSRAQFNFEEFEEFCNLYDLKPENIHIISQNDFHLDMFIRPIGYPYILVNDEISAKEIARSCGKELEKEVNNYYRYNKLTNPEYFDSETIVKELKEAGFVPIKVGGVFSKSVNFMNAIVNKHTDGTISYITNSSKCDNKNLQLLEEKFKKELENKIANLREIYFISGENEDCKYNPIMKNLSTLEGGLHCLTLEEPDFDKWA